MHTSEETVHGVDCGCTGCTYFLSVLYSYFGPSIKKGMGIQLHKVGWMKHLHESNGCKDAEVVCICRHLQMYNDVKQLMYMYKLDTLSLEISLKVKHSYICSWRLHGRSNICTWRFHLVELWFWSTHVQEKTFACHRPNCSTQQQ